MIQPRQLVVFMLDEQRYALRLPAVERVVRMVEITPLPEAPAIVLGVINLQGRILPVVHIRQRFRLPVREVHLDDHLIIARTARRPVALVADTITGVVDHPENETVSAEQILPRLQHVEGVAKVSDGIILIHDLDSFLSLDEEQVLAEAMQGIPGGQL